MRVCLRGYDIYKNPAIPNPRTSGLTIYTEQLMRYWRMHHREIEIVFIRSVKVTCPFPTVVDGINVYGIDTAGAEDAHCDERCRMACMAPDQPHESYAYRARQLAAIIHREAPDILNLHNTRPAMELLHALHHRFLSPGAPPVILTLHDLPDEAMRVIAEHAECFPVIVAISTSVAERVSRYGIPPESVRVIHSGMDVEGYRTMIRRARASALRRAVLDNVGVQPLGRGAVFRVLMPARRVRHKGHLLAIHALARLVRRMTPARVPYLLISGSGMSDSPEVARYEAEMRAEVSRVGMDHHVRFLPDLSPQELCALYHVVDVVLTPSVEPEGFCFANIEAMLSRVPVVTSNVGGPLDYITHGETGYLITPNDVRAIEEALLRLSHHPPPTRLLDAAEARAATFTLRKMAERYLQLFHDLSNF